MEGKILQRAELYYVQNGKARHIKHWPDYESLCIEKYGRILKCDERTYREGKDFPEEGNPITEWPESPEPPEPPVPPEPPKLQTPLLGDYYCQGVRNGMSGCTDIPRLIAALKQMGVRDYMHQVWQHSYQWDDFILLAPECQTAGINLWLYNVPPSEPPSPKPFEYDYVRWAEEVAKLMTTYPVIQGMLMDDFNGNTSYFTVAKCQEFINAARAIAPQFKFIAAAYFGHDSTYNIGSHLTAGVCDALLLAYYFPHQNHTDTQHLRPQIEQFRAWIYSCSPARRVPLLPFIYGIRVGGAPSDPTHAFVKECLQICKKSYEDGLIEGVATYCLPKDKPEFIQAVASVYTEWPEENSDCNVGPERIMFCVGPDDDFAKIRGLGVTVIQCYELPYIDMIGYLDKAQDNNLKVYYSLIGQDKVGLADNVYRCKDHPALYCWHTFEELNLGTGAPSHSFQKEIYDFIKERDSKHPITQTISGFVKKINGGVDWDYINFDALDFLTPDLYVYDGTGDCWGMKPLEALELGARQEREYLDEKNIQKPVIFIFQCCGEPAVGAGNYDTKVPLGHIEEQFAIIEKYGLFTGGLGLWAWNHGYFGPATSEEMYQEVKNLLNKI